MPASRSGSDLPITKFRCRFRGADGRRMRTIFSCGDVGFVRAPNENGTCVSTTGGKFVLERANARGRPFYRNSFVVCASGPRAMIGRG